MNVLLVKEAIPIDDLQVFINMPLEVCEERDPKGPYKLARKVFTNNTKAKHT